MSLFTKLFPKASTQIATGGYFDTLNTYTPTFHSFDGGVYEASLCRSAIHTFASQVSKLDAEAVGAADLRRLLDKPNPYQVMSQFLYQLATIYECENTAFIFPELDRTGERIVAMYAATPSTCEVLDVNGVAWLRCRFKHGKTGIVELSRVGILPKYQYKSLFFGTNDNVLRPVLELINTQNQGIIEGVKASASIRFLAKIAQTLKPKDLEEERDRFVRSNLTSKNNGGVMMFDAKYSDVKQIASAPFVVDSKQMELINENVYSYFGISKDILQGSFSEDTWNAYYESKVEPFAILASQVLTNMLYTERELGFGNYIILSANRLQYASNKTKLDIVTQLMDRGMLTPNEGRRIFNMSGFGEEGDKRYIRLEYTEADSLAEAQGLEAPAEEGENNGN